MARVLLIAVRFHDGRFHGAGDWPPSPFRLFQALVAGAARGSAPLPEDAAALCWLEKLHAPTIAVPQAREGAGLTTYVPNNDLDAVGGHPRRIGEIRAGKAIKPRLFDPAVPLLYFWTLPAEADDAGHPATLCAVAERLFQFGRGIDMAWATADLLDAAAMEQRLADYPGPVHRPSKTGTGGQHLRCPQQGSLDSLIRRHQAQSKRFRAGSRKGALLFAQPPKPRFRMVAYECPPARVLFELRAGERFAPWPLRRAAALVETLRDLAAERLRKARPDCAADIERLLVGRGAGPADIPLRPRLLPLPSIGFVHADHAIRRVLLEVPPDCPLPAGDLRWAFTGLAPDTDAGTGEIRSDTRLVPAEGDDMLRHYGLPPAAPARCWRSITPLALPQRPPLPNGRDGAARAAREATEAEAVRQALRHAGLPGEAPAIRVQREPFDRHGQRAEAFAEGTRFPTARLRHVELRFAGRRSGPLVLGDGRWLGLGLMAPVRETSGVLAFQVVEGLATDAAAPPAITAALRRAVMARVREALGTAALPPFFTGHAEDGGPLRPGGHAHLACAFDRSSSRLLVIAPHLMEAREPTREEERHLATLDAALAGFAELRAGAAGRLVLHPLPVETDTDPIFGIARRWESVTPYRPTRHAKRLTPGEAIAADILRECRRRHWPEPRVTDLSISEGPRGGLAAMLRLEFTVARPGPVLLGCSAHAGGGMFRVVE